MAQITIRKLDDAVKQALRKRAAAAGRSVEDEARRSLTIATGVDRTRDLSGCAASWSWSTLLDAL